MIGQTVAMEFVTTATGTEALLLEANLIMRLHPRYNVLLRDDKSFPHILITGDHGAPRLTKHRGARSKKGTYFGPIASAGAVNRTIGSLQRAFLIRTCSDSVYDSRTRPCLLYQTKRCAAPCTGEISLADYAVLVDQAKSFLAGKSDPVRKGLTQAMANAAQALDYEAAAGYRDRLAALALVQSHQGINPAHFSEADVFALHREAGQSCVQVFFFRAGQNLGSHAYFPRADKTLEPAEVLEAFVAQFYDKRPCPRLILLSHQLPGQELLEQALDSRETHRVHILTPKRGERAQIIAHAASNASEALARRVASHASQAKLLQGLAEVAGLSAPPQRVEVYDNSHIQGTHAVGAMIVAGTDGLAKNQYRKFNIKSADLVPGDDYGMMREVIGRRFKRLLKAENPGISTWPDLLIIDGGKGQLGVVREVLEELGATVPVIAVAKGPDRDAGRERIFRPHHRPIRLDERDPVLYFIQRLRDEAHRFPIGSHRPRRKKAISASPIDEVPGIGPARKRALLNHFGTARAISRAARQDLASVDGISLHIARIIYDFFHEQND
ncbi:MAG: excinuclease ABC subunit UvrC, partial [Hyphomicrobiales bacterium]